MAPRSPAHIQRWLDDNLYRFDLPVQYAGTEPNAARKDWDSADVRWCMVASWVYEAAAGNSSIPAVYKAVNDGRSEYLCDRFYLPNTPGDLKLLDKAGIGAFGIESKRQLREFDVIGSSISYAILAMSYVKLLTMSDIPLRWKDRDGSHPMVIVGGLSYGAPEVLAPVVDCWWLGEVEDEPGNPGITAVNDRIAAFKEDGRWRHDRVGCYQELALEFRFLYFPRFVDVHYRDEDRLALGAGPHPSKQVSAYTSNLEGMRLPFVKRHVKDLDKAAPLVDPPLLYADPAMGSGDLEVARGCPAWCSFCALSYRTKPYRQRTVRNVVGYAAEFARNMGSVRMAPFSPDFPMYTQPKKLVADLLEQVSDEVDAPTMRVDDFIADNQFILLQVGGGMDSVTLGVEGNSQRMRDLVGKGTSDEDIKEAVTRAIAAGIRKIKLFMITNLPGEDEGDIYRILKLAKDLADIRESMNQPTVRIQFSWTPLLIEAQTPMQWFAPPPQNRFLADVFEEFRQMKIDFKIGAKAEPNRFAFFQLCQRASRDIGEALVDAMEEVDQACWGGVPRTFKDLIERKLIARGFRNGYADAFDERLRNDMFGYEMIDQGISTSLLWKSYLQMREFLEQTDSHTYDANFDGSYHGNEWISRCDTSCQGKRCGACDHADLRLRTRYIQAATQERQAGLSSLRPIDQRTQAVRIRARIDRPEANRYVGNDHWRFAIRRAAFRAQHTLGWGFGIAKRSIRFASDHIKGRDWAWGCDYVEFALTRPCTPDLIQSFIDAMNAELAAWTRIGDWIIHSAGHATLRADIGTTLYRIPIDAVDPATVAARLAAWNAAEHVDMRLPVQGGYFAPAAEIVNGKDFVDDLWLQRDDHRLALMALLRPRPSAYHVYGALLGRPGIVDLLRNPAQRIETFLPTDRIQQDFLRPNCLDCGLQIPTTILDRPHHPERCPHCLTEHANRRDSA